METEKYMAKYRKKPVVLTRSKANAKENVEVGNSSLIDLDTVHIVDGWRRTKTN